MAAGNSAVEPSQERELLIVRVFDAPRELVFAAWTKPEHLVRWWGPRGFTLPACKIDLRPGGAYSFHMRGSAGDDHWLRGVFREVVRPERLVMAGAWVDEQGRPNGPETLMTVTFADENGKTKLTLRQAGFESDDARELHREGWTSTLECLGEYLAAV